MLKMRKNNYLYRNIYISNIYIRAVKRLITSKIKVCVYIIYVGALCFMLYLYLHCICYI